MAVDQVTHARRRNKRGNIESVSTFGRIAFASRGLRVIKRRLRSQSIPQLARCRHQTTAAITTQTARCAHMSLHYLVKYECQKWHHSEIRIATNDESQYSIDKNFRCDELLYYTFIIHSADERIFKIGEHLAKLQAKWLTVSYTPFALHFCLQRCRSRQKS